MKALILALSLLPCVAGQQSSGSSVFQQLPEERVAKMIKTLEPNNRLRYSLEQGSRGDGVHHAWMDKMQQLGLRQASFIIRFAWREGVEKLKISDVKFLQHYYQYDAQIKDRKLLRLIRARGLEKDLSDAILVRARETVPQLMKSVAQTGNAKPSRAVGKLYLNLLDDEVLPVLDGMPTIEWKFLKRNPTAIATATTSLMCTEGARS